MRTKELKNAKAHEVVERALGYFMKNRHRMQRHSLCQEKLLIRSGAVDAANRVLINQRMKLAGKRWSRAGGPAVRLSGPSRSQAALMERASC